MLDLESMVIVSVLSSVLTLTALCGLALTIRNRLYSSIVDYVINFSMEFINKAKENPKTVGIMLKPFLTSIVEEMSKDIKPDIANADSNDLLSMGMNFLPKKYRGLAFLAQHFLGKKSSTTVEESKGSPFG